MTTSVCVVDTAAVRGTPSNEVAEAPVAAPPPKRGIAQAVGKPASNLLNFQCTVNGKKKSLPVKYKMKADKVGFLTHMIRGVASLPAVVVQSNIFFLKVTGNVYNIFEYIGYHKL